MTYAVEARESAGAGAGCSRDRVAADAAPGHACCSPRAIVALEKRFCFTMRDMDARAPAFEHLLSLVEVQAGPGGGVELAKTLQGEGVEVVEKLQGQGNQQNAAPSTPLDMDASSCVGAGAAGQAKGPVAVTGSGMCGVSRGVQRAQVCVTGRV
eukprot:CAMPEP_0202919848 /NCGR_PEP_ID=MMETSP1392-20130828/76546_1 /ASSEMBLY_ACC=CAM_ASM_000868 /TAXON_ID=225041 /ORGANISM="Chlamydomonas chlamydogama, Strain SAG 11-48b" /LENGTH=153 /DNA_ID=CAMNT_0049613309 /DNA_START=487 /DNA_END=949 /DNA_ORIENTATION=+